MAACVVAFLACVAALTGTVLMCSAGVPIMGFW